MSDNSRSAKIIYVLYLVGIVFTVAGLVGVVMAYIRRDDAPDWLRSHYQYQIKTFWIGAIYWVSGVLLSLVVVGYFILLFWVIWLTLRCIRGLKALEKQAPAPDAGWFF